MEGVPDASGRGKPTQTERLVGYADAAELFCDPAGQGYATVRIDGHLETWPLKGGRFGQWLLRRYYLDTGKAPGAQAMADARATIAAKAMFDGPERGVFVRVAGHDGAVYVDLCNRDWEAVEVSATPPCTRPSRVSSPSSSTRAPATAGPRSPTSWPQ